MPRASTALPDRLRSRLKKLILRLERIDGYGWYLNPVTDEEAPGYSDVVKNVRARACRARALA